MKRGEEKKDHLEIEDGAIEGGRSGSPKSDDFLTVGNRRPCIRPKRHAAANRRNIDAQRIHSPPSREVFHLSGFVERSVLPSLIFNVTLFTVGVCVVSARRSCLRVPCLALRGAGELLRIFVKFQQLFNFEGSLGFPLNFFFFTGFKTPAPLRLTAVQAIFLTLEHPSSTVDKNKLHRAQLLSLPSSSSLRTHFGTDFHFHCSRLFLPSPLSPNNLKTLR